MLKFANPLFHHFCRPKISRAQNGLPRLTRWVCQTQVPVQHRYMDLLSYKYGRSSLFLLPSSQSATHPLAQPSFHFLSSLKDHLPPSRFWLSFLSSALLSSPFCPSSSPPQAGRHRYNPSKVALHPTVRSLPTCLVETRTCLCRMINVPISGPLSITVSTVSN